MELQSHLDELEAAGAVLWAVSGDDTERLSSFVEEKGITFPMLQDPEGTTFVSYGILNEGFSKTVPHPTVIVVDSGRVARFVVSDDNYKVRPPSPAIVAAVESLVDGDG